MKKITCWNDSHCHLDLEPLCSDLPHFLSKAQSAGVQRILVPGLRGQVRAVSVPGGIFFAWGIHPAFVTINTASKLAVESLFQGCDYRPLAIGECGLDKFCKIPLDLQIEVFRLQAALAQREGLPIIVHVRGHWQRVQSILAKEAPGVPWIFHAYGGSPEFARQLTTCNGIFSLAPSLTASSAVKRHKFAEMVPSDQFLLETDAPDMFPEGWPADFGDPSAIVRVGRRVAELKNITLEEVAEFQNINFETIFGKLRTISEDVQV